MKFLIILFIVFLLIVIVLLPALIEIFFPKDNKPLFINQNYYADLGFFLQEAFKEGILLKEDLVLQNNTKNIATLGNTRIPIGTEISGWLHCNNLDVEENVVMKGKTTSRNAKISSNVIFTRLSADDLNINFDESLIKNVPWNSSELHNEVEIVQSKQILKKDKGWFIISQDKIGNLVVKGNILIKSGVKINGAIKANENIIIEDNVYIGGSIFSEKDIEIGDYCVIAGHVVAENNLNIGKQFQGGFDKGIKKPITILGNNITIDSLLINGTIWAKNIVKTKK